MNQILRRNLLWDYLNKFGNTVFSLITTSILAHFLSPKDYGLVGISAAVNGIAGVFFNFGLSSAIIQAEKNILDNKSLSTIFFFNQSIAFTLWFSIALCSGWIGRFYNMPELSNILIITSLVFIINGASMVPSALLQKELQFKKLSLISLASNCLSGFVGIYLALTNHGVWSLVFQQLCNGVFLLIGYFLTTKWLPQLFFKIKTIYPMLKFGIFMFLSGMIDSIFSRLDVFIIGKVFTPEILGQYTRAQGLDVQVRVLSANSLMGVLFPSFVKMKHDVYALKDLYTRFFELVSFSFCFIGGIFYLAAYPLFRVMFGSQWNLSAGYFQILIMAGFAYPLSSLSLSLIEARGNSKSFFKAEVLKKILFLPTYYIAFKYGIEAYLFSYFVCCAIGTFINVFYLTKEIPVKLISTIQVLSKYFLSSVIFIVGCVLLQKTSTQFPENNIWVCTLQVALFVVAYLTFHILGKSKGPKYVLELLKRNK